MSLEQLMAEILAAQAAKQEPVQPQPAQPQQQPVVAKNPYNQTRKDGAKSEPEKGATKSPASESASRGAVVPDEPKPLVIEGGMFDHLVDEPIEDVRRFLGTSRPELPAQYVEKWDEDLERDFLTFSANNQLPSQTAQRILDFYAEMSIVSSDQSRERAIARFNETFADLPKPVRDKLVEFYLIDLLGDGEEQQA